MTFTAGDKVGPYEVRGLIGVGGMGEVYRARDTKLGRDVAIKILPSALAGDPGRRARFEREAKVLASLNHPNIAAIYGLEGRAIVMELVEGPTLAERLKSGPIDPAEALRIAGQIAEAIEAAHEKGIIHRDLKPANIKLTPSGIVKVLDFGLAKALSDSKVPARDAPLSDAETATMQPTEAGTVLGTAAYMSPEQAEGKPVDKRTDVWSFGVVLYEMLSGRRCFEGKTPSHILVHVLEQEPDWERIPSGMRDLLKRCLQRDAARRLRDFGDVRLLLETTQLSDLPQPPSAHPSRLWPAVAAILAVAVAALAFLYFREKPAPSAKITRLGIPQPADLTFSNDFALSPDGRKLAFIAIRNGQPQIGIRSLDAIEPQMLAGTEGAAGTPFWSPDGRYVVFWAQRKVQKIEVAGGPTLTLCNLPVPIRGGFWSPDDRIVFGIDGYRGLREVAAAGGSHAPLTTITGADWRHGFPSLLPDGRHFVYMRAESQAGGGIYLGSLDAKPTDPAKKLLSGVSATGFVPAGPGRGYLLFVRAGTLMAQPFDPDRLELVGDVVPLAQQLGAGIESNNFSASAAGTLVYRTGGGQNQQLTWFDRQGRPRGAVGEPSLFVRASAPRLSPDGKKLAVTRTDVQSGNTDISLLELARGTYTRFTFNPSIDGFPLWSPDGNRIVYTSHRDGAWGIYQKALNQEGSEELLYKKPGAIGITPTSWSSDGRFVLFQTGGSGVLALPMEGDHKPIVLLPPQYNERGAGFSPDGRFVSYVSNETGESELYVRPFDPTGLHLVGEKTPISTGGAIGGTWRADGKEILYRAPDGTEMSVAITTTPGFQAEAPKPLFKSSYPGVATPDGQRFLVRVDVDADSAAPYTVVLNWLASMED
jgi:eukaryotic-like serine/threonine-protein kinase